MCEGKKNLTESVTLQMLDSPEGVEGADALGADGADLGAEGDLVDLVREVVRVGLLVRRVRRHVEVARNLQMGAVVTCKFCRYLRVT